MKSKIRLLQEKIACSAPGGWFLRTVAAPLDPIIYKLTGGRSTLFGPPVMPQLMLTTAGRKSGKNREIILTYTLVDDSIIVVASNFGQQHHPAWSHNLDANPTATMDVGGKVTSVRAERLSQARVYEIWDQLVDNIPMYEMYIQKTNRQIKVYRLDRI